MGVVILAMVCWVWLALFADTSTNNMAQMRNKNEIRKSQRPMVDVQIQIYLDPQSKQGGVIGKRLPEVNPKARISTLKKKIEKDIGILQEMYSLSYLDSCPLEDESTLKDHFFVSGSTLRLQPWELWQDLLQYCFSGNIEHTLSCMNITGSTNWNKHCAWIALYIASHKGFHDLVARLLKLNGIMVNKQSGLTGWTPLHAAARMGHWKVLCILLDNGANVRIKDLKKLNAFDLARIYYHKKCENSLNFCQWNLQKHYIVRERSKDYDAHKARRSAYRQTHLQTDSVITPWMRGPRGQIYTAAIPNTVTIKTVQNFDRMTKAERGTSHVTTAERRTSRVCFPPMAESKNEVTGNKEPQLTPASDLLENEERFDFSYGWFDEQRARQLIPKTDDILTYANPSADELQPRSLLNPEGFTVPAVNFPLPTHVINKKRYHT